MLEVQRMVLGPVSTNAYLIADLESGQTVAVDPAWDGEKILAAAKSRGWKITQVWISHGHFDHFGGVAELVRALGDDLTIALHHADLPLWEQGGLGGELGYDLGALPVPTLNLAEARLLRLGETVFQVRHAPGHSPGSCLFYCASEGVLFSGDLLFQRSVGRTDLPGGDWETLLNSIRHQVYDLPDETRVLPGHGDETTVGEEKCGNPFIQI